MICWHQFLGWVLYSCHTVEPRLSGLIGTGDGSNYQIVWITKISAFHKYYKGKWVMTCFLLDKNHIGLWKVVNSKKIFPVGLLSIYTFYVVYCIHKLNKHFNLCNNFTPWRRLDFWAFGLSRFYSNICASQAKDSCVQTFVYYMHLMFDRKWKISGQNPFKR